MTWIVGASSFGHGAATADLRVVWPGSSRTLDCLQKLHALHQWLMAAFAGSVEIGFALLADAGARLQSSTSNLEINPRYFALTWYRRARRIFQCFPEGKRRLGSQLLLVGLAPGERFADTSWPVCYLIVLKSPTFFPTIYSRPFTSVTIGTGSAVGEYTSAVSNLEPIHTMGSVFGSLFNGFGGALGFAARNVVRAHPSHSVAPWFFSGTTTSAGVTVQPMRVPVIEAHGPVYLPFPTIAATYGEFTELTKAQALSAGAATATLWPPLMRDPQAFIRRDGAISTPAHPALQRVRETSPYGLHRNHLSIASFRALM